MSAGVTAPARPSRAFVANQTQRFIPMSKAPILALLTLAGLAIVLAPTVSAQTPIWSEEFDGEVIDRDTWTFDVGGGGFGNWELEYYTARPENAWVEDGHLVIQALREAYDGKVFTSARLKTHGRFSFQYGTIEARVRIPDLANGLWPAFWLLGDNIGQNTWPACGEVDILEMGMEQAIQDGTINRRVSSAAHWEYEDEYAGYWLNTVAAADLNDDYHLFKLEWTPDVLRSYLDGVEFWSMDISQGEANDMEEFHQPYYMIINLAVGGVNFVEITDPALITAPFPAQLMVDWIRVYDNGYTELYFPADWAEDGPFGVFTETTPVDNAVAYGEDAELYVWNNLTASTEPAYEGEDVMSFEANAGDWFGLGVFCLVDRNMLNYENGYLHFHMKTTATHTFGVGIASSGAGESWLDIADGGEQFGLQRDGEWHELVVPLARFSNIDFNTITQLFMFKGEAPGSAVEFAIDNVYWTPSEPLITPENGSFGVYTETAAHKSAGEFALGTDGEFYVWENTLNPITQAPYEGSESLAFSSAAGLTWFGAAFTANMRYNLSAFRYPESVLHFAMKSSSTVTFDIGMRSGSIDHLDQKWIRFEAGNDPYGFARDGQWHVIEIPMTDISDSIDLTNVAQIFEILGVSGGISNIEIDDICFLNGGEAEAGGTGRPQADAGDDVTIVWPTSIAALDGSDSEDSDGTIVSFEWQQVSGPSTATITDPNMATPTVSGLIVGEYVFELTVTDDDDRTDTDSVRVTVATPEPTADAGADQTILLPQTSTTLTGTGYDADGTIVGYLWTQISGPNVATLTNADTATVTVSDMYYEGEYIFELTVTDNDGLTGSDQVSVTLTNVPQNIALGKPATASSATGSQLVSNGGFEDGDGASADDWSFYEIAMGSSTAIAQRVETTPYSGSWRLSLLVAGAADGGPAAEAQQLTPVDSVVAGATYDLSGQMRTVGTFGAGVVAQLCVQWLDSDGSHGGGVKGSTGFIDIQGQLGASYAPVGISNIVAANGADAALIIVRLAGGAFDGSDGEIACDDVMLTSAGGALVPGFAVDGDDSTRWGSESGDPQWIQVELEGRYEISQVVLDWATASALVYDIDVSEDGATWTTAYSTDAGAGGIETIDLATVGRFIRLYAHTGNTNDGCSLYEFEVYGTPAPGDIDGDGDVDMDDFDWLADCMTGPDVEILTGCVPADLDRDAMVDMQDVLKFQTAFDGGL